MKPYLLYFLLIITCPACSVVNKQYYYVPDTAHHTTNDRVGYFKMENTQFEISDTTGRYIGTMTTSNGIGVPLLIGPPYFPVAPVGLVTIFSKRATDLQMDISIRCNDTTVRLDTNACYIIVNGSKQKQLHVKEFLTGSTSLHNYQLYAPIRFAKVRKLSIVTGNPLLDHTLKNMTFRRKKRLMHCIIGLS